MTSQKITSWILPWNNPQRRLVGAIPQLIAMYWVPPWSDAVMEEAIWVEMRQNLEETGGVFFPWPPSRPKGNSPKILGWRFEFAGDYPQNQVRCHLDIATCNIVFFWVEGKAVLEWICGICCWFFFWKFNKKLRKSRLPHGQLCASCPLGLQRFFHLRWLVPQTFQPERTSEVLYGSRVKINAK